MLQNIVGRNVRKVTGSDDTPKAKYVYTADGVKLSVSDGANGYDYLGSLIYVRTDGPLSLDQALFDGGVLLPGGAVDYFVRDHLGSVRVIVDNMGTAQEQNDYYPYGERCPESTYAVSAVNRYKYNGKEEQVTGDIGVLDYGARMYDSKIGRWFVPDPLAEKYYSVSPYAYCNNRPIITIDPDGRDIWELDNKGNIVNQIKDKTQDAFYMVEQIDGEWQRIENKSISFDYGTIISQNTYQYSSFNGEIDTYDVYKVRGDESGDALFHFMSDNITGVSRNEISQAMTGITGNEGLNFIVTSQTRGEERGMKHLLNGQLLIGDYTIRELNHSHPYNERGSMVPSKENGDIGFANQVYMY